MSLTLHDVSIGVMTRMLKSLAAILQKAADQAQAQGIDPSTLTQATLAADMLPFNRQIQIASDTAKGCAARLAGVESPSWADTEGTLPELQERISKTIAYLGSITPDEVNRSEELTITLRFGPEFSMDFTGKSYVLEFALPNFMFHVTTAYALLRAKGVEIGKRDFLGGV